jgi:hypothetical protein
MANLLESMESSKKTAVMGGKAPMRGGVASSVSSEIARSQRPTVMAAKSQSTKPNAMVAARANSAIRANSAMKGRKSSMR